MSKEDKIIRAIYEQILNDLEHKVDTEPHNIEATQNETTWQLKDHGVVEGEELVEGKDGNWVFLGKKISVGYHSTGKRDRGTKISFISFGIVDHEITSETTIYLKWYHKLTPLYFRTKRILKKGWATQRLNEALDVDKKYAKLNSDRIDKILLGDKKGEKEQSNK